MFLVPNLDPEAMLFSNGITATVDMSKGLEKRPEDIAFFRFRSTIHAQSVDPRIQKAGSLTPIFCLRLPYHLYDTGTKSTRLLSPFTSIGDAPSSNAIDLTKDLGTPRRLAFPPLQMKQVMLLLLLRMGKRREKVTAVIQVEQTVLRCRSRPLK